MAVALTPKGRLTRARIVAGAAEVLREHGLAATLDDVRERTRTSKSQLFHYFPGGKDQLLLAVAQHEADRVLDDQQPYLSSLDSWEAWSRWRDAVLARYEEQGDSCPLGTLLQQVGRTSPGARAVVGELLHEWEQRLRAGMHALQQAGLLPESYDVPTSAAALLAGVQGGVAILLATGSTAHLEAALDQGIAQLRAARPAGSPPNR